MVGTCWTHTSTNLLSQTAMWVADENRWDEFYMPLWRHNGQ
jgi:hypothetical protein